MTICTRPSAKIFKQIIFILYFAFNIFDDFPIWHWFQVIAEVHFINGLIRRMEKERLTWLEWLAEERAVRITILLEFLLESLSIWNGSRKIHGLVTVKEELKSTKAQYLSHFRQNWSKFVSKPKFNSNSNNNDKMKFSRGQNSTNCYLISPIQVRSLWEGLNHP